MIGRSLIVFQCGNNHNELYEVSPWEYALANYENWEKAVVKEAKKKKWKPNAVVSDAELKKIVFATNCLSEDHPGYHVWASDGVTVINLSGDPNLYNPAKELADQRRKKQEDKKKGLEKLKEFLPELVKLRQAIPTGTIKLKMVVILDVEVNYGVWEEISTVDVLNKHSSGRNAMYSNWLVDHDKLLKRPEMKKVVNCPHRAAYQKRCGEIANLLGLDEATVENETYFASNKPS